MNILVFNQQKDLKISKAQVKKTLKALLAFLKYFPDEISIQFVTEKKISSLHALYFDDPTPTDCITFPVDLDKSQGYQVLGEVFICPKTAKMYALKHKIDCYQELTLYLVHGVLHLIGYDDTTPLEKRKMRQAEKRCMLFLQKEDNLLKKDF